MAATGVTIPLIPAKASKVPDHVFSSAMLACGLSLLAVVVLIVIELVLQSKLSIHAFGLKFFKGTNWDPVAGDFGALPFIYGTIVSSFVALVIAIPLSLGVAVFITEMCPKPLRGTISFMTELLAAIPSVVYG